MMLRPKTWLAAARAAAGYSAPRVPFSSFPAALTVEGQIRRPEELPHVELIAIGGVWRPRGGRQLLQQRVLNPVTTQQTVINLAERIGPFPGGLVRSGMALLARLMTDTPAIGGGTRRIKMTIGAAGHSYVDVALIAAYSNGTSGAAFRGELEAHVNAVSDTTANHPSSPRSDTGGYLSVVNGYNIPNVLNPSVNFSQPWDVGIWLESANETAVNITGATWAAGIVTFTATNHTLAVGDKTTVAGVTPSGYNGVYVVSTVPDGNTFTATLASNPGTYTSGGTTARISNVISRSYSLELLG